MSYPKQITGWAECAKGNDCIRNETAQHIEALRAHSRPST